MITDNISYFIISRKMRKTFNRKITLMIIVQNNLNGCCNYDVS